MAIRESLNCFTRHGIDLPVQEYLFTILLANAESPYIILNEGYCGDGGIPGYIFSWLIPDEYTLGRLPVALAHETNHNVRFQFIEWKNDITLGEMMISEGLAENFATFLYGEELAGPWVTFSIHGQAGVWSVMDWRAGLWVAWCSAGLSLPVLCCLGLILFHLIFMSPRLKPAFGHQARH